MVNRTILARTHVVPALGAWKLAQLSAEEVDVVERPSLAYRRTRRRGRLEPFVLPHFVDLAQNDANGQLTEGATRCTPDQLWTTQ